MWGREYFKRTWEISSCNTIVPSDLVLEKTGQGKWTSSCGSKTTSARMDDLHLESHTNSYSSFLDLDPRPCLYIFSCSSHSMIVRWREQPWQQVEHVIRDNSHLCPLLSIYTAMSNWVNLTRSACLCIVATQLRYLLCRGLWDLHGCLWVWCLPDTW